MRFFRFVILIASSVFLLSSCKKQIPDAEYVRNAVYLYDNGTMLIQLSHQGITVFVDGSYVYQNYEGVMVEGEYPSIKYRIGTGDKNSPMFGFDATFNSREKFMAVPLVREISFTYYNPYTGHNQGTVSLSFPGKMEFIDGTGVVLDKNGDGIVDSFQPEFFQ